MVISKIKTNKNKSPGGDQPTNKIQGKENRKNTKNKEKYVVELANLIK